MSGSDYTPAPKEELRLRAVLALFKGETAAQVSARFGVSRSSLFDYKRRALAAMSETLKDQRRGPRRPRNRTSAEKEQSIRSVCECYPTLSSYQVKERLGKGAPTPRTIQRVRKRLCLPRLSKRLPPSTKARRFTQGEKQTIRERVKEKMYLGPHRLAWDIQNRDHIPVSPSTMRRVKESILEEMNPRPPKPVWKFYERKHPHSLWHGDFLEKVVLTRGGKTAYQFTLLDDYSRAYVYNGLFTDPDEVNVVRAIIAAMREYQTIPKALLFDNGRCFRGNLITAFCRHLGINLIHTSIQHPQTNGKLERAFRDDMREFYKQFGVWRLWELQQHLPEYVRYRNHVRGHWALGGKPAITRLREQDFFALPSVLEKLETVARAPVGLRVVRRGGYILLLGKEIYVGARYDGRTVCLTDTLDGLEVRAPDGKVFLLPKYRKLCKPAYPTPNHGHAGEAFVRHLNGWSDGDWQRWQRRYVSIRTELLKNTSSDLVGRVSGYIAAIQLAAEVACPLLGLPFKPDVVAAWLMLHLDEQQSNQNLVLQALRALADHYISNMSAFAGDGRFSPDKTTALHGASKQYSYIGFLRSTIDLIFQKRKWNQTAVLNKMAEAGVLHATEGDRHTKKVSVEGVKHRMVCIKWAAILPEDAHDAE